MFIATDVEYDGRMSKFRLSDTMKFLTGKLNAITGGETEIRVELDTSSVPAGDELRARVSVRAPGGERNIDYIQISLSGQVQRDGKWQDWVQSAEVAHDTKLPLDHEFVVPVVILVPQDAVLTEDGGMWLLYARAYLDRQVDPRAEASFEVV